MKIRFILLLSLLLIWNLPLSAIKKETKLLLDEIQKLTQAVTELDRKVTVMNAEFLEIQKKVEILGERISAMSNNQADMTQNKDSINVTLQMVKEEVSELKNQIGKLMERINNPMSSVGQREISTPTEQTGRSIPAQDASNIYYTAYSDYIKENYDLAIEGFQQYLNVLPGGVLADNALYWIGECQYAKKKFTEAVSAFDQVIQKYKEGDKVPSAILKKGFALLEMGRQNDGMMSLRELITRYPFSDEATLARQRLKEMSE